MNDTILIIAGGFVMFAIGFAAGFVTDFVVTDWLNDD